MNTDLNKYPPFYTRNEVFEMIDNAASEFGLCRDDVVPDIMDNLSLDVPEEFFRDDPPYGDYDDYANECAVWRYAEFYEVHRLTINLAAKYCGMIRPFTTIEI
jgi:hypothetical protein